nr:MAG TPA: hypothetical protein [Caudoviricetes sp.]
MCMIGITIKHLKKLHKSQDAIKRKPYVGFKS